MPEGARLHAAGLDHLNQAWDLYYHVFRKINKHLPQVKTTNGAAEHPLAYQSTGPRDVKIVVAFVMHK